MNVKDMIERLQNAVEHGQNPEAEIMAWDADDEDWRPVSVLTLDQSEVHLYTDEP